jgi:hypothetical protein
MKTRANARHASTTSSAAVVLCLAVLAVAACGGDSPKPTATVTVTASPSGSSSTSPKPTDTPVTAKTQSVIAVAAGAKANALAAIAVSPRKTTTLVAARAGAITDIAWSPDRTRIAYSQLKTADGGEVSVWVYDVAAGKASPVLVSGGTPRSVSGFAWLAPTKLLVAVMVGSETYHVNGQMVVCDVAAGTSTLLKDDSGATVRGVWPSVATDIARVAYVRYGPVKGSSGTQPESLMVYDPATRGLSKVDHASLMTDFDNDSFAFPALSPDGSLVYSCRTGSDPGFAFSIVRVDGETLFDKSGLIWPMLGAWDLSSGRLAYGAAKGSAFENGVLSIWKPGTSTTTDLYKATKRVVAATAWSPTGDYIAYELRGATAVNGDLWIVGDGGGGAHLVLRNAGEPAWAKAAIPGL